MKHHPDRNQGEDKGAEAKFKEAKEAYEMLSAADKRAAYDQYGHAGVDPNMRGGGAGAEGFGGDRKSTRLNSSHSQISYAVFCLKKKKKKKKQKTTKDEQ